LSPIAALVADFRPSAGGAVAQAGLGLHQLRYVLAAAEQGGFRRAARRLGVQQSAVSRRIRELEDRLGTPIFERGPSGVSLTQAGHDFVTGAQGAVAALDQAVERMADETGRQEHVLRIGVVGAVGPGRLAVLLRRLLARDPGLVLDLVEGSAEDHLADLTQGRLDVGFLLCQPGKLESRPAWQERLLVALPIDHPLARRSSLRWRDLVGLRLMVSGQDLGAVRSRIERARRGGCELDLVAQASCAATVLRLVVLGQGLAVMSESSAMTCEGIVYRPLWREVSTCKAVIGRRREKRALRRLLALLDPRSAA
jgi:DNA-binding transcriptional LysR family regulator